MRVFYQYKFLITRFLLLIFLVLSSNNSLALSPENHLDSKMEERALALFSEVKCLICNGQSIEDSSTEFSFQMRKLIREKISDGKSDDQIKQELVTEFGEDILFFNEKDYLPILLVIIFAIIFLPFFFFRFFRVIFSGKIL